MIFLAAMPMIAGFANWIVPLQIGAPDLALPRLNALAFWLNPAAALLIFTGVFSGQGADTGWTGYAPYVVSNTAHSGATLWVAGQIVTLEPEVEEDFDEEEDIRPEVIAWLKELNLSQYAKTLDKGSPHQ